MIVSQTVMTSKEMREKNKKSEAQKKRIQKRAKGVKASDDPIPDFQALLLF